MSLKLKQMAEHSTSGFKGLITAICHYSTGCLKYCITPLGLNKDGKPWEGEWFDSAEVKGAKQKSPEGPMPLAPKHS